MSPGLSRREYEILRRIENDLRRDRKLDHALRTMRTPRRMAVTHRLYDWGVRIPALSVALMAGFAIALTVLVAPTGTGGPCVVLGVIWGATVVAVAAKIRRRVEHRRRRRTAPEDRPGPG